MRAGGWAALLLAVAVGVPTGASASPDHDTGPRHGQGGGVGVGGGLGPGDSGGGTSHDDDDRDDDDHDDDDDRDDDDDDHDDDDDDDDDDHDDDGHDGGHGGGDGQGDGSGGGRGDRGGHGNGGHHGHHGGGHGHGRDDDPDRAKSHDASTSESPDKSAHELEIAGRVVVREQFEQTDDEPWTGSLSLNDVRLEATWKAGKRVEIVVEVGAASGFDLKDGYADLRVTKRVHVKAGRFRMPMSALNLTSRWKLPTIDRGTLTDVLDDGLGILGRRTGAQAEWEPKHRWDPRLVAGVFQTTTGGGGNDALLAEDLGGAELTLRGELEPQKGLRLGTSGSSRMALSTTDGDRRRYLTGVVDATLDRELRHGHVRGWLEGMVGTLHLDATPATQATPRLGSLRALLAWRCGGAEDGDRYVEPYVFGGVFDPNLKNEDDLLVEAAVGVNVGLWDQWRVQLAGELGRTGELVPAGITGELAAPPDRVAVTVQLGAVL